MGSGPSQEVAGVRVFKVSPGSPAAEAGLEVFFDFIMEVNGVKMDSGYQQMFAQKIQESENSTAILTVFNTRAHAVREVAVKPRKWAGNGLLGATVRFDSVDPAENHGIRVLEVFVNSPAAHAGLVPYQDFLLGTASFVFHDIDELVEAVTTSINQQLQVYVYNADSETVREVPLVPNNDWGGEGCIGCDIGTGLLHRIPAPRRPPGTLPESLTGVPAISPAGTWPPAAGLLQPAYPPGVGPQAIPGVPPGAVPVPGRPAVPAVPGVPAAPAVPGVPGVPGVPTAPGVSVTGVALSPGIPPVPSAPAGSLPGISTSGAWAPPPAVPAAGAAPGMTQAPPVTSATVAQLQAQIQQLGSSVAPAAVAAPAPTGGAAKVAGVSWPPQPKQPQPVTLPAVASAGSSMVDATSPTGLPGRSTSEIPQAPPSTPMNQDEMPPPVDLSGLDPSRFAASGVAAAGIAQPGAAVL
mmetsp:Transcript_36014/g.107621  ORF Transcript_36014/g.107621 Transcript_36014/m.107621 type:complete len:466 (+) Transcript_36014:75-1472(+)